MGLIDELKDFYGDDYSDWIQDGGDDVIYFIQKTRNDILGEMKIFYDKNVGKNQGIEYILSGIKKIISARFGCENVK